MTENFSTFSCRENSQFNETVCIDAYKIYDSCADKDFLEDLRVNFNEANQHIIDQASGVRVKNTNIITAFVDVEPVPFRSGYYSVDTTCFFDISLEAFVSPSVMPASVSGLCVSNKKAILYGSEVNIKTFSSNYNFNELDNKNTIEKNLPRAVVQIAKPIALSAKLCNPCDCRNQVQQRIPDSICMRFGGEFVRPGSSNNAVAVTFGIFTVIRLERNVQISVPACNYCMPKKECVTLIDDNPSDVFNRIEFPTSEFFPTNNTNNISNENIAN